MEAVYQLLKSEFRQFGTGGISLVLALTALLFLMAEWKRLSRGCRMYTAYAACMLVLVGNPFGYNDISTFWMETSYWKMFFLLLPAVAAAIPVTELAVGTKHVWTGALGVLVCAAFVAVSMSFQFTAPKLAVPENAYHVEHEIAELDDALRESGRNIQNMIAPRAVCAQIRELDASVNLLYGEDLIERMIAQDTVTEDETEKQFISDCASIVAVPAAVDNQIAMAEKYNSNCVILEADYDDQTLMESAGYDCYGTAGSYVIYFRE